jgi:hypothetical protein
MGKIEIIETLLWARLIVPSNREERESLLCKPDTDAGIH